jgi:hypothetical protein
VEIEQKRIFFCISPHINYYHSYRGDSIGPAGFGHDLRTMAGILSQIEAIEAKGLCGGVVRVTWDYADLFWSVQLQQAYQPDVLEKVIERCRAGKDDVLIGSWGNVGQPWLDAEEFRVQHAWNLENSMGIGLEQLFPGRVAPYVRNQETMLTQGMIEEYAHLGVEGVCVYYSAIPFDNGRPFLNPRLDWNQRYGLVRFDSMVSDASTLMIPMYGFGDALDHLSVKSWFKKIRRKQEMGEIRGHALVFLNFDMDSETWTGRRISRIVRWLPNMRGLWELAEAVDALDYVEFANLIDVIPRLVSSGHVYGKATLGPDVADGNFNGFHNWAQKYNNTKFWTIGQRARYLKCVADTLTNSQLSQAKGEADALLRDGDDTSDTYLKHKLLFASTTHFGMAMPLNHPHRDTTAVMHARAHYRAAARAAALALEDAVPKMFEVGGNGDAGPRVVILPMRRRGITEWEQKPVGSPLLVRIPAPSELAEERAGEPLLLRVAGDAPQTGATVRAGLYASGPDVPALLETVVPPGCFGESDHLLGTVVPAEGSPAPSPGKGSSRLEATPRVLRNESLAVGIDAEGNLTSLSYEGRDFGCHRFLDSGVGYGEDPERTRAVTPERSRIDVVRDGSDGVSAALRVSGDFEVRPGCVGRADKVLTVYAGLPALFVAVETSFPRTEGAATSAMEASAVQTAYDPNWQEVMPCEVRPDLVGDGRPLRIWRHNFLGRVSCFDLDMREVDAENADMACLSSAISDGWMAVSTGEYGLLVGFNALEAANFAYAPIKVRDRGFGDASRAGQQIRLNPFGTYFGRMLHYWHDGTGHAQEIVTATSSTYRSTGPSFNGKTIAFELVLVPYRGDAPPDEAQSLANHFAFPPLALMEKPGAERPAATSFAPFEEASAALFAEFDLEDAERPYLEWVRAVNENPEKYGSEMPELASADIGLLTMLRVVIDGIRGL